HGAVALGATDTGADDDRHLVVVTRDGDVHAHDLLVQLGPLRRSLLGRELRDVVDLLVEGGVGQHAPAGAVGDRVGLEQNREPGGTSRPVRAPAGRRLTHVHGGVVV